MYAAAYPAAWRISDPGPVIPGLTEGAVPQGLAYWPDQDWIITSNYRTDGRPSCLMIIDRATGGLVKQIHLAREDGSPYTGHAGGVALSGRFLWVSSNRSLFWLPLSVVAEAADQSTLRFAGNFLTPTRGSSATFADDILWVGDYHKLPRFATTPNQRMTSRDGSAYNGWMVGYRLQEEVTPFQPPASPAYILSIPDMIQSMAVTADAIILSQSDGLDDSSLLRYRRPDFNGAPHQWQMLDGERLPVWYLDGVNQTGVLRLPPMSEGLAMDQKGCLYVLFESAAHRFAAMGCERPMERLRVIRLDEWT